MKTVFRNTLGVVIIALCASNAWSLTKCWQMAGAEEVCFDITNHGFVRELTGVAWAMTPQGDMCVPLDGASLFDPLHNVDRLEFTRMIGLPIATHNQVHHTIFELDPATFNGTWADQHGVVGGVTFIGNSKSPNNPCIGPVQP